MIQTETSKAKILLVKITDSMFNFSIKKPLVVYNNYGSNCKMHPPSLCYEQSIPQPFGLSQSVSEEWDLPFGNWTILNVLDDVTEDEAEMVVDDFLFMFTKEGFKSYLSYDIGLRTATESIHSLATSLGVEGKTIVIYQLK